MPPSAVRATGRALSVVLAFTVLFCWLFARLLASDVYLAESDLFDWFLPNFLSSPARWSSAVFAGLPSFADTSDASHYPVRVFFARVAGSWNGYAIAAYVLAASFTTAYVWQVTASRAAALFAGLAFALSEAMVERQAHINFVHAFAWLPLLLLSIERLLAGGSRRWVAIGGGALACCFLSGHPQPVFYVGTLSAAYAVVGAIAERTPPAVTRRLAALFVLGAALPAVKALPFLEATRYVSRSIVSYGQFVAQSHSPAQMLGLLFPTIQHNGREAPLYVGLGVIMLAGVGALTAWRGWRVRLWLLVGLLVLLVAAGDSTVVARLAYELPLFNKFRVAARMLFLFAFAMATLAGLGVAAIERKAVSPARLYVVVGAVLAGVVAGAVALLRPLGLAFEARHLPIALPLWDDGVWAQLAFAAASAVAVLSIRRWRKTTAGLALLSAIVAADLLYSLPYPVSRLGLDPVVVEAGALQPSVHARSLREDVAPARQRLLSIGGTTRDAILPAGFARLWNVPIAGGYSPIVLARLAQIAQMGGNGDVRPSVLASEDRGLDLLAVRYAIVREDDFPAPATFERDGTAWNAAELGMFIGRPECGHRYPRSRTLDLPEDVAVSTVALVVHMRCAEDVAQGTEVAALAVFDRGGARHQRVPLVAGVNVADRSLSDPAVRARARHRPAEPFDDPSLPPHVYAIRVDLPQPLAGGRLVLEGMATGGWTTVERLTLIDAAGGSHPQDLGPLLLADESRWRAVKHVRTSRTSDRTVDEDAAGELGFTVYENRRALPRAWIAAEVVEAADADALAAIRHSQLPEGRAFDPRAQALVPPGSGARRFTGGGASARVLEIGDGAFAIDVSTEGGGYLVLSEMFYPGWRARIGARPLIVTRTNFALQGVAVPPGRHTVHLEFSPMTLTLGAGVSVAALGCALLLLWRG